MKPRALNVIGLEGKERTSAALLSGGEKQRVGILGQSKGVRYILRMSRRQVLMLRTGHWLLSC